jgi:uncharacterized membrane protein HdeD (DUF308 family)
MKPTDTLPADSAAFVLQHLSKNWWILLIRGIFLVLIGGYATSSPGLTLATYCLVLGFFLIADGILALIFGMGHHINNRGWVFIRAALSLLTGLFMVGQPLLFAAVAGTMLVFILAFQSLFAGVLEIMVAIRDRKAIQGEGWMIMSGLFSVLFGLVLLSKPLLSVVVLIQVSGIFAMLFGFAAVFSAFRLRKLKAIA